MGSLGSNNLNAFLNEAPQPSTPPQATPWIAATADRLLLTSATAVTLNVQIGSIQTFAGPWTQSCAAFSAFSPRDPTRGQQYFCLAVGGGLGMRFDYALNPAAVPGAPASH